MVTTQLPPEGIAPGKVVASGLRIEALLGEGGTALVYRVHDVRSGRKLALKLLRAPNDERRALVTSQFEREYHTLSQLAHPRIIEVFDYGLEHGTPYYTMELLDGEDLHERGQLTWRTACSLLCDVASSLAMLHSRGLVHRDVSARNVRCTSDGRAKLLDFGAMVAMGASYRAVGTPPFVPPEVLQLQALDGRADLFGLGALAYWMLTGRHAFAAHNFNQLRDVWRTSPRDPSTYAPELPQPLSELVMTLLRLERGERPRSAAEVMERLSGIAGLSLQELPQVGRAYLITPVLVGRDAALKQARDALLSSMQSGHGSAVLIDGPGGIGRSRFLDACVLEAKLMGATVVRGSPAEGGQTPYGLVAALGSQLLSMLPVIARQNARPRLSLLAHVLPELAPNAPASKQAPERRHLQAALRDWLLAIARVQHLVIAVDDVHAIDEPSAALLGALAHGAKRRHLTLLLTVCADAPANPALGLLRELSRAVALQPLEPPQTEALLRSLFGDADHVTALAERIHAASQGYPRRVLTLAEHLATHGAAQYEAGSWTLPANLCAADLPQSERDAIRDKLARLSTDARAIAQALALTDPTALSLPDYPGLTEHREAGRTFTALDELLSAGFLLAEGEHYRPTQSDVFAPLAAMLDAPRRRELHTRLANVLRSSPRTTLRQQHMLLGDAALEAIDALLAAPEQRIESGLLEVLQCAVEIAQRLGLPQRTQLTLRYRLVRLAATRGHYELFMRMVWPLIECFERDSGIRDCLELDAAPGGTRRWTQALARAQQRYDATPEATRGLPPQQSLMLLATLHGACAGTAPAVHDITLIERLCSLEPFLGMSPALDVVHQLILGQLAMLRGRHDLTLDGCLQILAMLDSETARASMRFVRLGIVFLLGLLQAGWGQAACLQSIAELDAQPGYRGNAWRVRARYQLAHGDLEGARDCQRRAELLDLQDVGGVALPGTTLLAELNGYVWLGDVLSLKRIIDGIEAMAALYPGWAPTLAIARSHYKRVQGDLEAALAALKPAFVTAVPGRHFNWGMAAEAQILILHGLGRDAEAAEHARAYLAQCESLGLELDSYNIKRVTAEALVALDRLDEARRLSDETLAGLQRLDVHGACLGAAHETRARVALTQRDETALREHAQLCAREYAVGRNPNLTAKYERLLREAASAGLPLVEVAQAQIQDEASRAADAARTVYSRMLTCISPSERAQRGLQLMLEATGAEAGYLFGLRSGRLTAIASTEQSGPPAELSRMLDAFVQREFEGDTSAAAASLGARAGRLLSLERFIDEMSREFEPMLLAGQHHGEAMIAGVAALHYLDDERPSPRAPMLDAVIEALIADDIVDPITCVA